jgi:hypothetical protein
VACQPTSSASSVIVGAWTTWSVATAAAPLPPLDDEIAEVVDGRPERRRRDLDGEAAAPLAAIVALLGSTSVEPSLAVIVPPPRLPVRPLVAIVIPVGGSVNAMPLSGNRWCSGR